MLEAGHYLGSHQAGWGGVTPSIPPTYLLPTYLPSRRPAPARRLRDPLLHPTSITII